MGDADAEAYREAKQAFVSDLEGSSLTLINAISLVPLSTVVLWAVLAEASRRRGSGRGRVGRAGWERIVAIDGFAVELALLVLPVLAACTGFATTKRSLLLAALLLGAAVLVMNRWAPIPQMHRPVASDRDGAQPNTRVSAGVRKRTGHKTRSDDWRRRSVAEDIKLAQLTAASARGALRERAPRTGEAGGGAGGDDRNPSTLAAGEAVAAPEDDEHDAEIPIRVSVESSGFEQEPRSPRALQISTAALNVGPDSIRVSSPLVDEDDPYLSAGSNVASPIRPPRPWSSVATHSLLSPQLDRIRNPSHRRGGGAGDSISSSGSLDGSLLHTSPPAMRTSLSTSAGGPASSHANRASSKPFLTIYRAHMMLMTILCILAVDFPIFPRYLAKCESWGTSLMDLGVGSFVFSMGIVGAAPFLKERSGLLKARRSGVEEEKAAEEAERRNRKVHTSSMRIELVRQMRKSAPLLLLALLRILSVKGTAYPEHQSEYGTHWNFFLTLAVLPILVLLLTPLKRLMRFSALALLLSAAYELALQLTPLQEWLLRSGGERSGLLEHNKEGILSLVGYLAIYLLGIDLGHYVLPPDPFLAYRRISSSRHTPKNGKLAMVLASYSILWWSALGASKIASKVRCAVFGGVGCSRLGPERTGVSRRMANMSYVLWVVAYNTTFLLLYLTVQICFIDRAAHRAEEEAGEDGKGGGGGGGESDEGGMGHRHQEGTRADGSAETVGLLLGSDGGGGSAAAAAAGAAATSHSLRPRLATPRSLDALNRQALVVFLAANVLTGVINLSVRTMYASATTALVVLSVYLGLCFALAVLLQERFHFRVPL